MKLRAGLAAFTLLICSVVSANAVTFTVTTNSTSNVPALTGTITYPSSTISDPAGYASWSTTTSYGFNQGTSPFGESNWLSLNDGQDITFTFSQPMDYVGFYWGTPDGFNNVGLYDGSTLLASYTGNSIGYANYANFFASDITSIVLSSGGSYFETDNLSYQLAPTAATVTPEPSSLLLFGSGLVGFAGMVRRRMSSRVS